MTDDIEEAIQIIAGHLDYPSIYMGGPSRRSLRKATMLMESLQQEGFEIVKTKTMVDISE